MKLGYKTSIHAVFDRIGHLRFGVFAAALIMSGCGSAQGEGNTDGGGTATRSAGQESPATTAQQVVRPAPGTAWVIFGADTVVDQESKTFDNARQPSVFGGGRRK